MGARGAPSALSTLLVDSGVWLASRDPSDRFHADSVRLLEHAGEEATVAALDLTLYEVVNVAAVRWRSTVEVERLVRLVETVVAGRLVRIDRDLALRSAAVAGERGLSVYDGAYVACALARGWRLVSTDIKDLVEPGYAAAPDRAIRAG